MPHGSLCSPRAFWISRLRLLCVNGINDSVFPISDHYLLLEHGQPKSARFYPVGHMGFTPETEPMIINWVATKLERTETS